MSKNEGHLKKGKPKGTISKFRKASTELREKASKDINLIIDMLVIA